jgi:hypothetical protein
MLCDDLLADELLLESYDGIGKVFDRIRAAQKFTMSKEFTVAADGLVENHDELYKIVPYCRLPYPATWIEWLHDDRPHWNPEGPYKARPVDRTRHQIAPQRIGLLLEQQDDFAGCWKAHLFWSAKTKPSPDESQFNGSLGAITIDTRNVLKHNGIGLEIDPLLDILEGRVLADFGQGMLNKIVAKAPDIAERLMEYAVEDWGGEVRFMVAVLGLLNTRNVAQFSFVDKKTLNTKRAKHGRRPLFSHTILKIRPEIWISRSGDGSGDHRDLRLHFVRGHFKHRKTGLFWWSMHARGHKKLGVIEKEYEL